MLDDDVDVELLDKLKSELRQTNVVTQIEANKTRSLVTKLHNEISLREEHRQTRREAFERDARSILAGIASGINQGEETLVLSSEVLRGQIEKGNSDMYQLLEKQQLQEKRNRAEREAFEKESKLAQTDIANSVKKMQRALVQLASNQKTHPRPIEISVDSFNSQSELSMGDDETLRFQREALEAKEAEIRELREINRRLKFDEKDANAKYRAVTRPVRDLSNLRSAEQPLSKLTKKSADNHADRIRKSTRIRKQRENSTPFKYC
ncbi:hypothetical protein THAOC_34795 [Thalassiosira oceanica]|uniref:Uncharacterized protein n=1 Tax=Thalassiosira oceanica TaxID=159749 RepID=K0R1Y3_THAOC|nr:hypothetical protein THAOC_34795 [Thalassiosira oceanica]|eukprot:EJK46533.1 hypothetical protein THAOC_34795 [Thalassiosira oceanica]